MRIDVVVGDVAENVAHRAHPSAVRGTARLYRAVQPMTANSGRLGSRQKTRGRPGNVKWRGRANRIHSRDATQSARYAARVSASGMPVAAAVARHEERNVECGPLAQSA